MKVLSIHIYFNNWFLSHSGPIGHVKVNVATSKSGYTSENKPAEQNISKIVNNER